MTGGGRTGGPTSLRPGQRSSLLGRDDVANPLARRS